MCILADSKRTLARETIKNYEKSLGEALKFLDFNQEKLGDLTIYKKSLSEDFVIYLFSGAYRKYGGIFVDPILHMDYLPLKKRLEEEEIRTSNNVSTNVFYFLIQGCSVDDVFEERWSEGDFIEVGASVEHAVDAVVWTMETYALPLITKYTTVEALHRLFEDKIKLRSHRFIVTTHEQLKLSLLREIEQGDEKAE